VSSSWSMKPRALERAAGVDMVRSVRLVTRLLLDFIAIVPRAGCWLLDCTSTLGALSLMAQAPPHLVVVLH